MEETVNNAVCTVESIRDKVVDIDGHLNFNVPHPKNFDDLHSYDNTLNQDKDIAIRSESVSSVASSMNDKIYFNNTMESNSFNTMHADSGSTNCSYVILNPAVFKAEQTFNNLHTPVTFQEPKIWINGQNYVNAGNIPSVENIPNQSVEHGCRNLYMSPFYFNKHENSFIDNNVRDESVNTVCLDSTFSYVPSNYSRVHENSPVHNILSNENVTPHISQKLEMYKENMTSSTSVVDSSSSKNSEYSAVGSYSMTCNVDQKTFSEKFAGFDQTSVLSGNEHLRTLNSAKQICVPVDEIVVLDSDNSGSSTDTGKKKLKTRKQRQKEMEERLIELEKEKVDLLRKINNLEIMTNLYKKYIASIMKPLHNV